MTGPSGIQFVKCDAVNIFPVLNDHGIQLYLLQNLEISILNEASHLHDLCEDMSRLCRNPKQLPTSTDQLVQDYIAANGVQSPSVQVSSIIECLLLKRAPCRFCGKISSIFGVAADFNAVLICKSTYKTIFYYGQLTIFLKFSVKINRPPYF